MSYSCWANNEVTEAIIMLCIGTVGDFSPVEVLFIAMHGPKPRGYRCSSLDSGSTYISEFSFKKAITGPSLQEFWLVKLVYFLG